MNYKKLCKLTDSLNHDITEIPREAWEYFADSGGIPVLDYGFDKDPYGAIAEVLHDNFNDAMQGVTGGGVETYYEKKGEPVPDFYKAMNEKAERKAAKFIKNSPWGEIEEWTVDGGVGVFYPPYEEDKPQEPYGYYSAWDDSIHDWV